MAFHTFHCLIEKCSWRFRRLPFVDTALLIPCLLPVTPWAKPPMTAAVWSKANGGFITQTFKDEFAAVGCRPTGP